MTISVIIPTCNGAPFIREALESVFSQTVLPTEIIVVDDASTDATTDIVKELTPRSPVPLRLLTENKSHGGPAAPLNAGIAAARGDYIAVLDQDDVFLPEKLEQQSGILQAHPDVAAIAGICAPFPGVDHEYLPPALLAEIERRAAPAGSPNALPPTHSLAGPDALHILMGHGNFVVGFPGFMFRKTEWAARGGLDESLKIAADLDFFLWLCTRGRVAFMAAAHYQRREHADNLCRDKFALQCELQRVFLRYRSQAARGPCDCRLERSLRDLVFAVGWWAKDRGRFATSAGILFRGVLNWPYDWRMSAGLLKLPFHWCRAWGRQA